MGVFRTVLAAAFATSAAVLCTASCGPDPVERCRELSSAECPAGQTNVEDGPEYCESYYDSECSSEWDDYVECAIEDPHCSGGDAPPYTPCFENEFKVFAQCLCDYESQYGASPWCF